jgi:hypothetical protein
MFLSLEILVILLTYLLGLLKKWIKNGGKFKVSHIYLIPNFSRQFLFSALGLE